MQKTRDWLEKHGNKLLIAVSLCLISSGILGQLRGRNMVLVTDPGLASQVKYSPVWLLYACAAVPILVVVLTKRNAQKEKKRK